MPSYTTRAICLKAYDYSESSRILNFYCPENGLIRAIAKGAKRHGSKLAGACELLNLSEIQLASGRNLHVLCQYQSLRSFRKLRTHIRKLAFATLFADLVSAVATEHDACSREIFALLHDGLESLESLEALEDSGEAAKNGPEKDLWALPALGVAFHLRLLEISGYAPVVDTCLVSGTRLGFDRPFYLFSLDRGSVVATPSGSDPESDHRVKVSASTLQVLTDPSGDLWARASVLKVFRFLQYYVSYKLEKPVRAYDFVFQALVGASAP